MIKKRKRKKLKKETRKEKRSKVELPVIGKPTLDQMKNLKKTYNYQENKISKEKS